MPLAIHSSAKMGQPRCLQTLPLVENHHTRWPGHTFLLLRGEAAKPQEPRTNLWWSQQASPRQTPDEHLRRLNVASTPFPRAPPQPRAEGREQPPKTGGSLHLWERVLEARRSEREDLLCDFLSRAHVTFSAHKAEILEIDVTTFVTNWHGQLILQIHHGETLPAPKVSTAEQHNFIV